MSAQNKKAKPGDTITWRKVKDEAVVLNLETSEYYSVNPSGTLIWELLTKQKTRKKIAEALSEEYGISLEEASSDTEEFIKKLSGMGLIEKNSAFNDTCPKGDK